METGLFEIQAEHLTECREARKLQAVSQEVVYALFRPASPSHGGDAASTPTTNATELLRRSDCRTYRLQECLTYNIIMSYNEKEHRHGLYKTSQESSAART